MRIELVRSWICFLFCSMLIFAGTVPVNEAYAQSKTEIANLEANAKAKFDNFQFYLALPMYLTLHKLNPNEPSYKYFLAYCYLHMDNNEKALPYFEECLKTPEFFPQSMYYYAARTMHLSSRFDEAIQYFGTYIASLGKKRKNQGLISEVEREMTMCETAKELIKNPINTKVINVGAPINTEYREYAPIVSADHSTMIFTSSRPSTTGGLIDDSDGDYYEDIYISYKVDSIWSPPVSMGPSINTDGHDASIALSPDGQKLLLYRYGNPNATTATSSGDLYISELIGNSWTPAIQLPSSINSKGWEPSASFSADEKILYFASDREGGYGGTDIYSVKKLPHGEWALPMNMGPVINTAFNEDSPYLHPDGKTLYFSSEGHMTMGGYDIFYSKYNEQSKSWTAPENLGYPINTPHDDLHFSWTTDGRRVYFPSIRPGGYGDRDIYYADIDKEAAEVMIMKGVILDSITKKPVEAQISVTDINSTELTEDFKSNSLTGKYLVLFTEGKSYRLTIHADNYIVYEETIDIAELHQFEEKIRDIYLIPLAR